MSEESKREEIKDETHQLQDEEQEELDDEEEEEKEKEVRGAEWEEGYSNNRTNISLNLSLKNTSFMHYILYHPLINPIIINPGEADTKACHC